jgi:glycosyltransferase involved in cell wall biosynthesis
VTRIACFTPYPQDGPSVRHRIAALGPGLAEDGATLVVWSFMSRRLYDIRRTFGILRTAEKLFWLVFGTLRLMARIPRLAAFDAVIIHREAFPLGPAWFERWIARVNPHLVYDVDDAIWEPPGTGVHQRGVLFRPGRYDDIMRRSRVVAAGSALLAEHARRCNARVFVVPTAYGDLGGAALDRPPPDEPVVMWIGNWGNAVYLAAIAEALATVAGRHRFRLLLVGGADIDDLALPGVTVQRVRWSEADERERLLGADIGIMPLPDTPYERGKCAFKLIQYMSAGLAVVASPVGANVDVVDDGVTGFLAADAAGWVLALDRLLADPALRRAQGRAGYRRYRERYSVAAVVACWRQILAQARS